MRRQGRVALTPSAYKYRGSAGQKEEEKRGKRGRAGSIFVLKKEEGNRERETDWVETETTETEKHKKQGNIGWGN
jgi:hypothetical protein